MEQGKINFVPRLSLFPSRNWLDDRELELIFAEHYPRVYAVLFRLTGDQAEADDLAAEVFWKLWKKPPARDENLAGWLYRVALRLGYNALRSVRRRAQYESRAGEYEYARSPLDPASEVEQRSENEQVRAVLRQMSQRDVQLLLLRYSGLSYKEIAQSAGISPTSVGSLLARAEEKFEALFIRGDSHAPER
jgi:RNA polymerase sigma-70 factor, ECF subfamily